MSSYRVDTVRLAEDVDRVRLAGTADEISYREIARQIGVGPSMFTRLNDGYPPGGDALLSLLLWLGEQLGRQLLVSDYALLGDRRLAPPPTPRRREYDTIPRGVSHAGS